VGDEWSASCPGTVQIFVNDDKKSKPAWRKLRNKELHNFYSSPSIIRVIKPKKVRWAGHVARMEGKGSAYWWESQMEIDHWEDQGARG
jgi:hypothetical protein